MGCSRTGEGEQAAPAPGSRVCSVVCVHHYSVLLGLPGPLHSRLTPVSAPAGSSPLPSVLPSVPAQPLARLFQTLQTRHHAPIIMCEMLRSHSFICLFLPLTGLRHSLFQSLNYTLCPAPNGSQHAAFARMKCYTLQTAFYQFTMNKINLKIQFLMPCLD